MRILQRNQQPRQHLTGAAATTIGPPVSVLRAWRVINSLQPSAERTTLTGAV